MALIKLRRGTAAEWTAANPRLEAGEPGIETDTHKEKRGDGLNNWNALPYTVGGPATTTTTGVIELATAAEVTLGTDDVRAVTPAGLKTVIDAKVPALPTGVFNGRVFPYTNTNIARPAVTAGTVLIWLYTGATASTTRPPAALSTDIVLLSVTLGNDVFVPPVVTTTPSATLTPSSTLVPNTGG